MRYIQKLLGHESTRTTEIYTKVSKRSLQSIRSPLDRLKDAGLVEEVGEDEQDEEGVDAEDGSGGRRSRPSGYGPGHPDWWRRE